MPKYASIYVDSCSELARLYFSKAMGKAATSMDSIRGISNYPEVTERLNMLIRRLKTLRDQGTEIFFTAHEDIQSVYARGGMITPKGQTPQEPIGVKGWPDMPGKRTPDEMCRAADNVFRIRNVNGKPMMIGYREPLGGGGDYWEVKDRFNAPSIRNGNLPFDYNALAELAKQQTPMLWSPAYIWILYGSFGIGKTRFSLTVPRPVKFFDLDRGTKSIENEVRELQKKEGADSFKIESYDVEDVKDYSRFISDINQCF